MWGSERQRPRSRMCTAYRQAGRQCTCVCGVDLECATWMFVYGAGGGPGFLEPVCWFTWGVRDLTFCAVDSLACLRCYGGLCLCLMVQQAAPRPDSCFLVRVHPSRAAVAHSQLAPPGPVSFWSQLSPADHWCHMATIRSTERAGGGHGAGRQGRQGHVLYCFPVGSPPPLEHRHSEVQFGVYALVEKLDPTWCRADPMCGPQVRWCACTAAAWGNPFVQRGLFLVS